MIIHALLVFLAISFSYLLYLNFYVHSFFIFFIGSMCAWNGAMKYYKMMTKYYESKIKHLIDDKKKKK